MTGGTAVIGEAAAGRVRAWALPVVGLVLFGLALWAIHRELDAHVLASIDDALEAMPWSAVAAAVALTALSYASLALYDPLALRWLGRKVPAGSAALTGFVSFALVHNIGLAPLTGGAARYRLYATWNLTALDIGAVFAFNSTTATLGMMTTAGLGGLLATDAVARMSGLPDWLVLAIAVLLLVLAIGYALAGAVWRGELRWRGLELRPPPIGIAVPQLALALIDWCSAGLALWILLPAGVPVGPVTFLALFVTASLVAIFSHVPAGLGVFEAVVLVGMPDTSAQPGIAAALVIYRMVYYLLPLVLAGLVLGGAQLRRLPELLPGLDRLVRPWARLALPNLLAPLVGICGVVLLASGVTPAEQARMAVLAGHVPLPVIEAAHFMASLCGLVLLPAALGLRRRLDSAWTAGVALLAAGIVLSLLKGLDWEEALLLAITLLIVLPSRRAFYRRSALTAQRFSPTWLLAIVAVLLSVTWLGFFSYRHVEYGPELWWQFVADADAPRFLRATAGCFVLLLVLGVMQLVGWGRPPRPEAGASPEDLERAAAAIAGADSSPSSAWVALLGDKQLLFSDSGRSFVMYGIRGRSWIAFAEPIGLDAERIELLWRFRELADRWGARIAFYEAPARAMPELVELGLAFQKLGEQAFVDLAIFSLEGGKRSNLRQTVARGRRDGSTFEVVPPEGVPAILDRLAEISDAWLAAKNAREKGFSLGRFDRAYLSRLPVGVMRRDGRIVAFANLWPSPDRHELSIDLMRYGPDAPRDVMEHLFLELMLWGKAEGYGRFDLGMAPLSGLESRQLAPVLSRAGAQIFQHGEDFYNFEGLRRYKEKFRPAWEPRYLAAPGGLTLARVLADATLLIGGGVKGVLGK